jgi:hypothetical protein
MFKRTIELAVGQSELLQLVAPPLARLCECQVAHERATIDGAANTTCCGGGACPTSAPIRWGLSTGKSEDPGPWTLDHGRGIAALGAFLQTPPTSDSRGEAVTRWDGVDHRSRTKTDMVQNNLKTQPHLTHRLPMGFGLQRRESRAPGQHRGTCSHRRSNRSSTGIGVILDTYRHPSLPPRSPPT